MCHICVNDTAATENSAAFITHAFGGESDGEQQEMHRHGLREQSTSAPDKAAVIDAEEPVGGNQRRNQSRCRRSGWSHAQLTASHVYTEGQEHHEQISNPHE